MKKILGLFLILFGLQGCVFAEGAGYHYVDGGIIYSDVTVPLSLPRAKYNGFPSSEEAINDGVDIKTLKSYSSSTLNILKLVEFGNAGIYSIAKKGGLKTVYYVDVTNEKLYVPLIFIPIYFKRYITTVYGE